jgi:probable F420-dependent oxidoreductase
MQFGVAFPAQVPGAGGTDILAFADRAERLGFSSLWVLDRLVYDSLAPLPLLAAAAALTTQVRLGTSILLATLHSPLVLAKELATIDRLSNGRLTVGMALGGREIDFEAAAVPMRSRARRLEETIDLMVRAWSGQPIDHDGTVFSMRVPPMGPKPVQRPHPPLWLGGRSQPALERAVKRADGYIVGRSGPRALAAELRRVREALTAAGREPGTFSVAAVVFFRIGKSARQALAGVIDYLHAYYGEPERLEPEQDTVFGPIDQAAERIAAFARLGREGLSTLIFVPTSASPDQVDRLAEALTLAQHVAVRA